MRQPLPEQAECRQREDDVSQSSRVKGQNLHYSMIMVFRLLELAMLTWTAINGKSYRVEYKNGLDQPMWSNLPPDVTATGPTASKPDWADGAQRFYRIRER